MPSKQPRPSPAVFVCIGTSLLACTLVHAAEFAVDPNTLLLAHFNESARKADYANGWDEFAGSGAQWVEGYYGKAVDLTGIQFVKDFNQAESNNARFDCFGFYPYANVNLDQGTLECWFRVPPKDMGIHGLISSPLLGGYVHRQVKKPEDKWYKSLYLSVTHYSMAWTFTFLPYDYESGKLVFRQVEGFGKALSPDDWHHMALCWSKGELVGYLDGRPFYSTDMSARKGIALSPNPVRFIFMGGVVMDEFRISDVVRYAANFEPDWHGGARPDYAFTGVPGIKRYAGKTETPYKPAVAPPVRRPKLRRVKLGDFQLDFDERTGYLTALDVDGKASRQAANGLLLREGLAVQRVPATGASDWQVGPDRVAFTQAFGDRASVRHVLAEKEGVLCWQATPTNHAEKEVWLEPVLSVPLPFNDVREFFDGSWVQTKLPLPRRRDAYAHTMPLATASGPQASIGVGLDPSGTYNALVAEWVPEGETGTIRLGTKIALASGEALALKFFVFASRADFGVLNALERYHDLSPDLYRLRPDVPVYSYMATSNRYMYLPIADFWRQIYVGGTWGHGPGHTKADMIGTARWWDRPDLFDDKSYAHAKRLELLWGTLGHLRELIRITPQRSYDNFYPLRRTHYVPDLTPAFIVNDLWPGYDPKGDPLAMDQYYSTISGNLICNEHRTPIGRHNRDVTRRYLRLKQPYSPGFINDMSHTSVVRHADPIAKASPGRAFSRDKGTYVLGHCGRRDRYRAINSFVDNGKRTSIWSDGGWMSYVTCADSAAIAVEGSYHYIFTSGLGPAFANARYMLGEKPVNVLSSWSDWRFCRYIEPTTFTPATLRDYYRYMDDQLFLYGLRHGITFSPCYQMGRQAWIERIPILIESMTLGRQTHPGGRVAPPLWLIRGGRGLDTLLAVGNTKPTPQKSDVTLLNRYFSGAPILGAYRVGRTRQRSTQGTTVLEGIEVAPRDALAFKCVGLLDENAEGTVRTTFSGDGITMQIGLAVSLSRPGTLRLQTFAPMYRLGTCKLNDRFAAVMPGNRLNLPKGDSEVRISLKNRSLSFSASDWAQVDLIKNGKPNFKLVADKGTVFVSGTHFNHPYHLGFEHGTAAMLTEFLHQYDAEDGVPGNLEPAEYVDAPPAGYPGWAVLFQEDGKTRPGRVLIGRADRTISIVGATQGEMRRAMVVFLRLVDRKYPHIGWMIPHMSAGSIYAKKDRPLLDQWCRHKHNLAFFKALPDKTFLEKPLLRREYEALYAKGNRDFAGKYRMRSAPYLFEPTYAEDFVYGYEGEGTAESRDDLTRPLRPREKQ